LGELHREVATMRSTNLFLVLPALTFLACSGPKQALESQPDKTANKQKAPLSYYEATLNPSDFDDDVRIVQKSDTAGRQLDEVNIPKDSVAVEEEILQGFRIQIFASASIDESNSTKAMALGRLVQDSVYVVYDPPVYKVRVGDFPTRLEANQRLSVLINNGFPDAWVVPGRIIQRKVKRVPR